MTRHLLAWLLAASYAVRYGRALAVQPRDALRFIAKATNLSLCYVGFSYTGSPREVLMAARAGFLCCCYDVVTDWYRGLPGGTRRHAAYLKLLARMAPPDLVTSAEELRLNDVDGRLDQDGLERGVLVVTIITRLIGSYDYFQERCDIGEMGRAMQIVDDVLDFRQDVRSGDLNCLATARRNEYLHELIAWSKRVQLKRLCSYGGVLRLVVMLAVRRARRLLETELEGSGC